MGYLEASGTAAVFVPLATITVVKQWRGTGRFRSPVAPPWWPFWGWGWRAFLRGLPTLSVGVVGLLPAAAFVSASLGTTAASWFFLPILGVTYLIFAGITLWSRPKLLIPPWARSQSGAVREWGDWWKLRRPA